MSLIDLYYRAFRVFRDNTIEDSNSKKLRRFIAHANQQDDNLTAIKYDCKIEPDWIENIEEGLIYVEKAIREDRQFIRTEGEVIPIEKVKRVSKTSVEHLSRHSDYITRAPKNEGDLIPEKLYIVEKLNDYLVYENRFIYMLLCYLKDFIQMRLDKIKDKTTIFQTHMHMNKELDENQRHLQYQLTYSDVYKNDPLLLEHYKKIPLVDRVENIYAIAVSLLSMPLMKEVAKAPLIKPPVIKTNVLRMNPNFRAALKLYDFVTSYTKDGYTITENKKTFSPFPPHIGDEIAETIQLTSVIAYITGNDISDDLKARYEAAQKQEQALLSKKAKEELRRLKKRMVEMNEDPAEYILKLEKRNVQLEKDSDLLKAEQAKNESLLSTIESLNETIQDQVEKIEKLYLRLSKKDEDIDKLNQKYYDDMTYAETIHQKELNDLKEKHALEISELHEHYKQEINQLIETHNLEIMQLKEDHLKQLEQLEKEYLEKETKLIESYELKLTELKETHVHEIETLNDKYTKEVNHLESKITSLEESITALKQEIKEMQSAHKKATKESKTKIMFLEQDVKRLEDEKKFAKAQYTALQKQQGLLKDEDFSSKEKFKQLELEMAAYKKLFKEQWKKAKNQIREKVKQETFNEEEKRNPKEQ